MERNLGSWRQELGEDRCTCGFQLLTEKTTSNLSPSTLIPSIIPAFMKLTEQCFNTIVKGVMNNSNLVNVLEGYVHQGQNICNKFKK